MKKSALRLSVAWLGVLTLLVQALPGWAQGARLRLAPPVAELAAKARVEKEVAIFVSTDPRAGEPARALSDAIEADLGVRLAVKLVSGPPDPIYVGQMLKEHKAGVKPKVDLFTTNPPILARMRDAGLVSKVDWAALGIKGEEITGALSAVYVAQIARPVMYNTKIVAAADVPRSLDDLFNERWKKKIVSARIADVFAAWAIGLGADKTAEMVEKLMRQQEIVFAPVPTAIRTMVSSGQYPLGFGIRIGKEQVAAGAPVAYAPIKAPIIPRLAVVVEGGDHPAAATLIIWWMNNTDSGRRAIAEWLDWPRHTTKGTDLYELAQKAGGVSAASVAWWTDEFPAINARIDQVLRAR